MCKYDNNRSDSELVTLAGPALPEWLETAIVELEKAKVGGECKAVEADLGPVRYLATLIGTADETAMRYFILVVALLLDPAAVLLLLAATQRGANERPRPPAIR